MKWMHVFAESNLSDEQLYKLQVVPKLLKEEQKLKKEEDEELQRQIAEFKNKKKDLKERQSKLYCGDFIHHSPPKGEIELMKDHWKTFREVCGITYQLVDTRDSVQICANIKVDISSKV
jgi:hypothetical protein